MVRESQYGRIVAVIGCRKHFAPDTHYQTQHCTLAIEYDVRRAQNSNTFSSPNCSQATSAYVTLSLSSAAALKFISNVVDVVGFA